MEHLQNHCDNRTSITHSIPPVAPLWGARGDRAMQVIDPPYQRGWHGNCIIEFNSTRKLVGRPVD